MQRSSRFYMAVHIAALLAAARPRSVTSERLAAELGAHPAFVRRILLRLAAAGLTRGVMGRNGGAILKRAPRKITLLDIHDAVESRGVFAAATAEGLDAAAIPAAFSTQARAAEQAMYDALAQITLKDFRKSAKT